MIEFGRLQLQESMRIARDFAGQTRGVAAVEFGLILPILLVLFLGSVELTNALTANRKVSQVASTVGDLVAQYRNLECATMTDIFKASGAIMTPYDDGGLVISVAGVKFDKDAKAKVEWSRNNSGGSAAGLVSEIPDALKTANTYLVVAKTEYVYKAMFNAFSNDQFGRTSFPLEDVFFLRPRAGDDVKFTC